ncbi:hypothetical protein V5O48_014327 [Marasmius crinis-equi]|uniref:Heme oxygenase n=1 Tax=Marasmius crinis-equi TaxID=585013 RepID=A0ABR3EXN8_9AGAR
MADYAQHGLPHSLVGSSTIECFLSQTNPRDDAGTSVNALYAQASILLHYAGNLVTRFHAGMSNSERQQVLGSFTSLDNLIDSFIGGQLPPMDGLDPTSRVFGAALLIHTLAYASCIQLHSVFMDHDSRSMAKSVAAAEACVALLRRAGNAQLVAPVIAFLWSNVGRVILKELARIRSTRNSDREQELLWELECLIQTMAVFAEHSALIRE